MVSHWSSIDRKFLQIFTTLVSILINNVVVWIVFTFLLISKYSGPFIYHLEIVKRAPIAIVSPSSSCSEVCLFLVLKQRPVIYLPFYFLLILFSDLPGWQSPSFRRFSFFLYFLTITRCRRLTEIK